MTPTTPLPARDRRVPGLAAAALAATLAAPLPAAAMRVATAAQPQAGAQTVAALDGGSFHDAARAAPGGRSERRTVAQAPAAQPPLPADASAAQTTPGPQTYALFLAGLGAVGWFASRRHPRQ